MCVCVLCLYDFQIRLLSTGVLCRRFGSTCTRLRFSCPLRPQLPRFAIFTIFFVVFVSRVLVSTIAGRSFVLFCFAFSVLCCARRLFKFAVPMDASQGLAFLYVFVDIAIDTEHLLQSIAANFKPEVPT